MRVDVGVAPPPNRFSQAARQPYTFVRVKEHPWYMPGGCVTGSWPSVTVPDAESRVQFLADSGRIRVEGEWYLVRPDVVPEPVRAHRGRPHLRPAVHRASEARDAPALRGRRVRDAHRRCAPRGCEIKKAQMKLLKKDLDRRRRVMANVLMESVDNSVAEGAAEFNIQMREVVKEVQEAKGYTRQDDALTEVLDAIHKKFPPAKLSEMDEAESVSKMRSVLVEIREELANPKTDEEKEADRVAQAKAELEKDPIDREPWRSLEKTLVEDQALTHEEAREQMNGVMKKIEEGAAANLERAKQTKEEPEAAKEEEETPEDAKRTITLGDISELANSSGELPPAKSIFEQAREEKEAEIEAKAKAAELEDEKNERKEPTGEFASTISALDRLTAAIDEKLEAKAKDGSQKK